MAELKTKQNDHSVAEFLASIQDEKRRQDSLTVLELFKEVTQTEPKMWGEAIVGFGNEHLKYASGRELDWPITGFSPRKQNLTLYLGLGSMEAGDLLAKLGKHKVGKGCLYINKLEDINLPVLRELVKKSLNR
jgi:hypothetical protein